MPPNFPKRKGFTLVELIIVIAVIGILAGLVFVAINPAQRLGDARDADRYVAVESILTAIKKYQADNGELPEGIDENLRMLGTAGTGCDITCGGGSNEEGEPGGSGGGSGLTNDYETPEDYTFSDNSLIQVVNGVATLIDQGVSEYSTAKPYVVQTNATTLDDPGSLTTIDTTYGIANDGTAEFSVEHNGTDKWWNGTSWTNNTGEMQAGDDLWDDVLATYHFNNDWTDAKGTNDGTAVGDATFESNSKLGSYAGTFSGNSDSYVNITNSSSFGDAMVDNDGGTFSFWAKWTNTGAMQGIFGAKSSSYNKRVQLYVNRNGDSGASDSGEIAIYIYDANSGRTIGGGSNGLNLNDGEWHHIMFVIDPLSDSISGINVSDLSLIVDGSEIQFYTFQSSTNPIILTSTSWSDVFTLGAYPGSSSNIYGEYLGDLDEFMLINKALIETEVQELYATQYNEKHSNTEAELDTNLGDLGVVNGDTIRLFSYLISNGSQAVELDELTLNTEFGGSGGGEGGGEEGGSGEDAQAACLDISTDLADYLSKIPVDPGVGTAARTYYAVKLLAPTGVQVTACETDQAEEIEVSR